MKEPTDKYISVTSEHKVQEKELTQYFYDDVFLLITQGKSSSRI